MARIWVAGLEGVVDVSGAVGEEGFGVAAVWTGSLIVRRWQISSLVANCFYTMLLVQLPVYRELQARN